MSPLAVRPGDFVEATVTPDLVYIEKPFKNNVVKVNLRMVAVTRLYTVAQLKVR